MAKSKDNTTDMTKKTAKNSGRTSMQSQNSAVKATKNTVAAAKSSSKTGKSAAATSPKSVATSAQKSVKKSNYAVPEATKPAQKSKVKDGQTNVSSSKRAAAEVVDDRTAKRSAGSGATAKSMGKASSVKSRQTVINAEYDVRGRESAEYAAVSGRQKIPAQAVKTNQNALRPDAANNQITQRVADRPLRHENNADTMGIPNDERKRNDAVNAALAP
ncbi:MAG: hypothetical protein K2I79_02680, partial [Clostridia bacterium]|nr:hypothetical protein [Clostridia bacterium]